jgi:TMEM175 potassium channel family protein
MSKGRVEAFSDGVIAILITIMVLELRPPQGTTWEAIKPVLPVFLTYVLSFVYLGIYWNNHHHMFQMTDRINGKILWANLHLLFWLSLIPFTTGWMGENHLASIPTAVYGSVLFLAALAYLILQKTIIKLHGKESRLKAAVGNDAKGKISAMLNLLAIALAFVDSRISIAIYILVALIWLVPDKRIESRLNTHHG